MPYNHKENSGEKYPIQIGGKMLHLSEGQIEQLIQKRMREDLAVQKLFEEFEVDLEQLKDLSIEIADLDGRYAETDLESMKLDKGLFQDGRFFEDHWFVVAHELTHFLSRFKENSAYFHDPEEVLGFCASIATELARGTDIDTIWNRIFPKIEFHFHDEEDARNFFVKSIGKAKQLLSN